MAVVFLDPGTGATGDFSFWTSAGTGVTSDTGTTRNGDPRSIKVSTSNPAGNNNVRKNALLVDAGNRISVWANFPSVLPSASGDIIVNLTTGAAAGVVSVRLTTASKVRLHVYGGAGLDVTGTTTLLANTWYRISLCYVITSGSVNEYRLYLNGKLEATASNFATATTGSSVLRLTVSSGFGTDFPIYYSGVYVDNGTDLADPAGSGFHLNVTSKQPASINANNWNTVVGTGAVNERPISTTNGMTDSSVTPQNQNYTLQDAATGDANITGLPLVARCAWVWAKQATAVAGTTQLTDNGSNTTITPTTSPALYTLFTDSASYPSNAAGIGMVSPGLAADPVSLYECGTIIAYLYPIGKAARAVQIPGSTLGVNCG